MSKTLVTINGHLVTVRKNDRIEAGIQETETGSNHWVRIYRMNGKRETLVEKQADW